MSDTSSSAGKPLRCAVIGLGMGRNHANAFHTFPDAELVAVADLDETRLAQFADAVGKDGLYTDHKAMLAEARPDLVAIALPNFLHRPVTEEVLAAGCHAICEKPMAMTVEEAEAMKAAAKQAGKQLGINFSQRFNGGHRAMEQLVAAGKLGDIYHAYTSWTRRDGFPGFGGWFGQKKMSGGGPLIDLGVHRIDRALSLMGYPTVASVYGTTHKKIGVPRAQEQGKAFDVEDFATGCVRFTNGASLIFEVSWAGHRVGKEGQEMRIVGTEGALEMGKDGAFYCHRDGDIFLESSIDADRVPALKSMETMVDCILNDRPFPATPDHGIQVQRILNGLYTSAEEKREVVYE
ncbi:MAG: Gfo/Idh/MocA family protein [Opitutales bacterium]